MIRRRRRMQIVTALKCFRASDARAHTSSERPSIATWITNAERINSIPARRAPTERIETIACSHILESFTRKSRPRPNATSCGSAKSSRSTIRASELTFDWGRGTTANENHERVINRLLWTGKNFSSLLFQGHPHSNNSFCLWFLLLSSLSLNKSLC